MGRILKRKTSYKRDIRSEKIARDTKNVSKYLPRCSLLRKHILYLQYKMFLTAISCGGNKR